jgi:transcriptional regulator with XRE-family HTH domain
MDGFPSPPPRPAAAFGASLRERRIAAGLSLSELSARVFYSKGQLSKIENGVRPATVELARRCDVELGAQGKLAELVQQPGQASAEPLRGGEAKPDVSPTATAERWTLDLPVAGTSVLTWLTPDGTATGEMRFSVPGLAAPGGPEPGTETLARIFGSVRELGRGASPGIVLPLAVTLLHAIRSQAQTERGADRRAALLLGSRVAVFAGWMAQEAGDEHAAARWTDAAVSLATAAGDESVADYARVRKALIALYRGDAGTAVALAAATRAHTTASVRVRRLAALREAQGHALAGDERNCMAALDSARLLGTREGSAKEPDAFAGDGAAPAFGSAAVLDMTELVTGWCLYDLGRLADAEQTLAAGLRQVPADARRSRARFTTRQALAQAAMRDLDQACDTMAGTLSDLRRADSATIRTDVCAFSRHIGRWRTHHAVREIQPAITSMLLSTPDGAAR